MEKLKRGTHFLHTKYVDEKYDPMLCEVTRIAGGIVYWKRPEWKKARMYFRVDETSECVKAILPHVE